MSDLNDELSASQIMNNLQVILRVRPLLHFEDEPAWHVRGKHVACLQTQAVREKVNRFVCSRQKQVEQIMAEYDYEFQAVVHENITSQRMYKERIRSQVRQAVSRSINLCVMAYGQTCSGKTYTILGVTEAPGIIPCVLRDLFSIVSEASRKIILKVSYLEIYNEKVYDLLGKQSQALKIAEDATWGCEVTGSTLYPIGSFEESLRLLEKGEKHREYGKKVNHERSSRSHTLLRIYVQQLDNNYASSRSLINIMDLAGSQRITSPAQDIKETAHINTSLFHLSNVLTRLSDKQSHIPFRDSKITRLLEASLVGEAITLAVFCISPAVGSFDQSLSTIRLAVKAKKIQLLEVPHYVHNDAENAINQLKLKLKAKEKQCSNLQAEVTSLKEKVAGLEDKIKAGEAPSRIISTRVCLLFDHENFHIESAFGQDSSCDFSDIKQNFLDCMQKCYEEYTRKIIEAYLRAKGDLTETEVKIEEICFMNMVYEHHRITQYKLDVLQELIRENEGQEIQSLLLSYYRKLAASTQSHHSIPSEIGNSRWQESTIKFPIQFSSSQFSSANLPEIRSPLKSSDQLVSLSELYGRTLFIWGSKKDNRVCKGETLSKNVIIVSNIGELRSVACGYHHSFVITREGAVYGWGKNSQRQICHDPIESVPIPRKVTALSFVRQIAAGWGHTLALTDDGRVLAWGEGKAGQLGGGEAISKATPTVLEHYQSVIHIYCGHSHSGFIDSGNDYYSFGFNEDYRLMIGNHKEVHVPMRVPIRDVIAAGLGVNHSCIITRNGELYCGGVGTHGELGIALDQSVTGFEKLAVADRQFDSEKYQLVCPLVQCDKFGQENEAAKVSCGENMTHVLTRSGDLFSFGKIQLGRVGHKNAYPSRILSNVDKMSVGCRHGLALQSESRKLYSWGFNMYGQSSGSKCHDIDTPEILQSLSSRDIVDFSCGFFHSAAIGD